MSRASRAEVFECRRRAYHPNLFRSGSLDTDYVDVKTELGLIGTICWVLPPPCNSLSGYMHLYYEYNRPVTESGQYSNYIGIILRLYSGNGLGWSLEPFEKY